jgi:hypothetical protein
MRVREEQDDLIVLGEGVEVGVMQACCKSGNAAKL